MGIPAATRDLNSDWEDCLAQNRKAAKDLGAFNRSATLALREIRMFIDVG